MEVAGNTGQSKGRIIGNSERMQGRQGTVNDAGNTEQSKGRIKGIRKGAREHGTESSKVAREQ